MFVDTDDTRTIRAFLQAELLANINGLRSDVYTFKTRPTYISKTQIRARLVAMQTVYGLWLKVGGYDLDKHIVQEYTDVYASVKAL